LSIATSLSATFSIGAMQPSLATALRYRNFRYVTPA
jgi:hypothetical protein